MSYHEWNREEMLGAGIPATEASTTPVATCTTASFTPINQNRALPTISPLRTLHSPSLDSNLYNLPEDKPAPVVPKGKKRKSQPKKGRSVSMLNAWEHRDSIEAFEAEHGVQLEFEVASPKRMKSLAIEEPSLTRPPPRDGDDWADPAIEPEQSNSQLTTPPDSLKKTKKRTAFTTKNGRAKQTELFETSNITKPYAQIEGPSSQPAKSLHGFITTEEQVKGSSCLTKTTLEKLASFRYRAKPASSQLPSYPPQTKTEEADHFQNDSSHYKEQNLHSSDHGFIHQDHSFFDEASWIRTDPLVNGNHEGDMASTEVGHRIALESHLNQSRDEVGDRIVSKPTGKMNPSSDENTLWQAERTPKTIPSYVDNSTGATEFEPSSNEAVFLDNNAGNAEDVAVDQHNEEQISLAGLNFMDMAECASPLPYCTDLTVQKDFVKGSEISVLSQQLLCIQVHESEQPLSLHGSNDLSESLSYEFRKHQSTIQVERSDLDDRRETTIKNNYASDDFDEGIDDEDLLAILSDPVVPESSNGDLAEHRLDITKAVELNSRTKHPVLEELAPGLHDQLPQMRPTKHPLHTFANISQGAVPQVDDDDDEFLMDEDEERELLKLADFSGGVKETFEPPASVQFIGDDESETREVYDSSLQYSPPMSRACQRGNRSSGTHADPNSRENSPRHAEDTINLVSMEDEENWNFINYSNAAEVSPSYRQKTLLVRPSNLEELSSSSRPSGHGPQKVQSSYPSQASNQGSRITFDDSYDYQPLQPFARPKFPSLVLDRSPVMGLTAQTFLRTCFRIGEMIREGGKCNDLKQDAIIEIFARVTFSSREAGTMKQHFQFADLFHDRPPFSNGTLANYKITSLTDSDSKVFIEAKEPLMARCLARFKRDIKKQAWLLHIINIRTTDWEEIKWTKRIVSADQDSKVNWGAML